MVRIHLFLEVILVTGGTPEFTSVEALTSFGTPLCVLDYLPDNRSRYTMNEDMLCGGFYTKESCLHYIAGGWTNKQNLIEDRYQHIK